MVVRHGAERCRIRLRFAGARRCSILLNPQRTYAAAGTDGALSKGVMGTDTED